MRVMPGTLFALLFAPPEASVGCASGTSPAPTTHDLRIPEPPSPEGPLGRPVRLLPRRPLVLAAPFRQGMAQGNEADTRDDKGPRRRQPPCDARRDPVHDRF